MSSKAESGWWKAAWFVSPWRWRAWPSSLAWSFVTAQKLRRCSPSTAGHRASGSERASNLAADAVVVNADPSAVSAGQLGLAAQSSVRPIPARRALAVRPHLGFHGRGERLSSCAPYGILSRRDVRGRIQRHIPAAENCPPLQRFICARKIVMTVAAKRPRAPSGFSA